jgi:proteasome accessory factor C
VRGVRSTGEPVDASTVDTSRHDDADLVYRPAATDPRVRLRLAPEASWVAESIPVEERRDRRGGKTEVVLAVSGAAFLERLVLSLGPSATVLGPPDARAAVAAAARRVLARYRDTPAPARRPEVSTADMEG